MNRFEAETFARVIREDSSMLGATPLIWCAKQRDDCGAAVEVLLKYGANPNHKDAKGMTALDHATKLNNTDVIKALSAKS